MEGWRVGTLVYYQIQSIPISLFSDFIVDGVANAVHIAGLRLLSSPSHGSGLCLAWLLRDLQLSSLNPPPG